MQKHAKVKNIIIMADENFGISRYGNNPNDLIEIELYDFSKKSLEVFNASNLKITIILPDLVTESSLRNVSKLFPNCKLLTNGQDLDKMMEKLTWSVDPSSTIFVSSDLIMRSIASSMGFHSLPHVSVAALFIDEPIHFVLLQSDNDEFKEIDGLVPYHLERNRGNEWRLLAAISNKSLAEAIEKRICIMSLPLDFSAEDLLFVYLDKLQDNNSANLKNLKVIYTDGRKMLLAITSDQNIASIPFHSMHGHFTSLFPNPSLLTAIREPRIREFVTPESSIRKWPKVGTRITDLLVHESVFNTLSESIELFDKDLFQQYVAKYSGESDLDERGKIISRHCEHSDNYRVIDALMNDLQSMGYSPYKHSFYYTPPGQRVPIRLHNVIADLPGTGYLIPEDNVSEKLRDILMDNPDIDSPEWSEKVSGLLSNNWMANHNLVSASNFDIRSNLKETLNLKPWIKWDQKGGILPGPDANIIIIGCHLDSTGSPSEGFVPSNSKAPGADDDGTGIAGTLMVAKYLSQFRGKFIHTIRFCFFNAEEVGLKGSRNFAASMSATGAPIKAVICMDMIGYNKKDPLNKLFEIHAGFDIESIRDISVPLAIQAETWAEKLGQIGPAQIYRGLRHDQFPEDTDLDQFDGAIRRSDHASFHEHGYPSILLSEDLFIGPMNPSNTTDSNPNYHKFGDKLAEIDNEYGSSIACIAGHMAKDLAIK